MSKGPFKAPLMTNFRSAAPLSPVSEEMLSLKGLACCNLGGLGSGNIGRGLHRSLVVGLDLLRALEAAPALWL